MQFPALAIQLECRFNFQSMDARQSSEATSPESFCGRFFIKTHQAVVAAQMAFLNNIALPHYAGTRYRDRNSNLRTQLERIIQRAGLKPWPKLFQNLRSTRETELAETYPIHVVCAWIGNTEKNAAKYYLQVTDEHFRQAATAERCKMRCSTWRQAAN